MAEKKKFQIQKLDSEDYERTEASAKVVKDGGIIFPALVGIVFVWKKFGPSLIKSASKYLRI